MEKLPLVLENAVKEEKGGEASGRSNLMGDNSPSVAGLFKLRAEERDIRFVGVQGADVGVDTLTGEEEMLEPALVGGEAE